MQNLYMMAVQIREQEMRQMAMQISKGLLSIEQAMLDYNMISEEAVLQRVADFKSETRPAATQQSGFMDINIQAA